MPTFKMEHLMFAITTNSEIRHKIIQIEHEISVLIRNFAAKMNEYATRRGQFSVISRQ